MVSDFVVIGSISGGIGTHSPSKVGGGMFSTGDLKPQSSGSASIGANQTGLTGLGMPPIPYRNIHMNSGVWHHDLWGQSGIIRIGPRVGASIIDEHDGGFYGHVQGDQTLFEFSVDGGKEFPLRLGASRATIYTNDIDSENNEDGDHPIAVIRTQNHEHDDLYIYSSGVTQIVGSNGLELLSFGHHIENFDAYGIRLYANRGVIFQSPTIVTCNTDVVDFAGGQIIQFQTTPQGNGSSDGDIYLSAMGGSGIFHYVHNVPHESWYIKTSNDGSSGGPLNNGFWPIAHSGNILEMIATTAGTSAQSKSLTIERPAANDDLTFWYTNSAITITEVESVLRGDFDASGQFAIRYASDRSVAGTEITSTAITCTSRTTGTITTSFASASIPADNWIWVGVSGVSGVATEQMNITIQYQ